MNSFYYNNLLESNQLFFCDAKIGLQFLKDLERYKIKFDFSNMIDTDENGDEYVEKIMAIIDNEEYKKLLSLIKNYKISLLGVQHYATYK